MLSFICSSSYVPMIMMGGFMIVFMIMPLIFRGRHHHHHPHGGNECPRNGQPHGGEMGDNVDPFEPNVALIKMISDFVGKKCKLVVEERPHKKPTTILCSVVEIENDWVKVELTSKKGEKSLRLISIYQIKEVIYV